MTSPCVLELQEFGQVWRCIRRGGQHQSCDDFEPRGYVREQESFLTIDPRKISSPCLEYPCGTQIIHDPHVYLFYGTPPNTIGEPLICNGSVRL